MKLVRISIASSLLALIAIATAAKAESQFEQYGDWELEIVHGEMSPASDIVIRTIVHQDDEAGQARPFKFGFRVFGRYVITQNVEPRYGAKNYWPYCEFEYDKFKIGESKAEYFAQIDGAGTCPSVPMSVVTKFKAAPSAKVQINYRDGWISLKGFSAAWRRLQELSFE